MAGFRHQTIQKEILQKDILVEIRKNHKLIKCPLCGGELTEPLCTEGIMIPRDRGSYRLYEYDYKNCNKCKIIWRLDIFNCTDDKDDGTINIGHQLSLEGWTNCFCRGSVFGNFVLIEESRGHHSGLGQPCPNIKKEKK